MLPSKPPYCGFDAWLTLHRRRAYNNKGQFLIPPFSNGPILVLKSVPVFLHKTEKTEYLKIDMC